jgi:hypothetical protein
MKSNKIFVIGAPRSGTSGMARMVRWLIGKDLVSQTDFVSRGRKTFGRFDIFNPSTKIKSATDDVVNKINELSPEPYFDSNWELSLLYYQIMSACKGRKNVKFIVNLRDPIDCASSLKQRWIEKFDVKYDDEFYIDLWLSIYDFILYQMRWVNQKPYVIEFEKYVNGFYSETFLDFWNIYYYRNPSSGVEIQRDKIIEKVDKMTRRKINHSSFDYEKIRVNREKMIRAYLLKDIIIDKCRSDNWLYRESEGRYGS